MALGATPMNEFFLDASFVIALTVPGDQHHEKASDLKEQIQLSNTRLITTLAVALEIGNALSGRKYHPVFSML
jgi:predicted nucleic acid-binding protein